MQNEPLPPAPKYYSTTAAVRFFADRGFKLSARTLEAHRLRGTGPRFHRLGDSNHSRPYYLESDLLAWIRPASAEAA